MRDGQREPAFGVRFGLLSTIVLAAVIACSRATPDGREALATEPVVPVEHTLASIAPAPNSVAPVSAPTDLSALVDRVHFAFRDDAGSLVGSHTTYRSRVGRDGVLAFVPKDRRTAPVRGAALPPPEGPAFALETVAVRIGERNVFAAGAAPAIDAAGNASLRRGDVTESWKNVDEGVEQSWTFAAKPAGDGALSVTVRASGYAHAGSTGFGEHFRSGEFGVRVGRATWVDASGVRTDVRGQVVGDALTFEVPRAVLDRSAFPAVLDPVVSAEFAFDQPVPGLATGADLSTPSVATDGTDFVMVWKDGRDDLITLHSATIVSGAPPVVTHRYLGVVDGYAYGEPSIVYDGTGYFVAFLGDKTVSALKLTKQGAADGKIFTVGSTPFADNVPGVAFGGGQYLVTWLDSGPGGVAVNAVRVAADRTVKDTTPIVVASSVGIATSDVIFDGTDFVVTWPQFPPMLATYEMRAAHVTSAGTVTERGGTVVVATMGSAPWLRTASVGGKKHLAVWTSGTDVFGAVVDSAFTAGLPNKLSTATTTYDRFSVSCDTSDCTVDWRQNQNAMQLARVSKTTGALVTPPVSVVVDNTAFGAAASTGSETLIAMVRGSDRRQLVRRYSHPALVAKDAALIGVSDTANDEVSPGAASDGTNYFAAWFDRRSPTTGLYAARIGPDGKALDAAAQLVASGGSFEFSAPRVAYASGVYLAAWWQNSKILGRRYKGDGTPLDAVPVVLLQSEYPPYPPGLATDGVGFFVTTARYQSAGPVLGHAAFGVFVGKTGDVSAEVELFSPEANLAGSEPYGATAAAYGSGTYGVGWSFARAVDGAQGVRFRRIAADGTKLDRSPLLIASGAVNAALTFDGESFIVAYDDISEGAESAHTRVARVSPSGKLLDAAPLRVSTGAQVQKNGVVAAAGPGIGTLVAWNDFRVVGDRDVFGTVFDLRGNILDPAGLGLAATPNVPERSPALASDGRGHVLVAYSIFDGAAGVVANRVRAKVVSLGAAVATACSTDDQCGSRHCSAGVCCDAACNDPCQTCSAKLGTCTPVTNGEDADSCAGNRSCNAQAQCIGKLGAKCGENKDCESQFCADGVCCNTACDGACDACDIEGTLGTCSLVAPQGRGNPSCLPYACNGQTAACATTCVDNVDCPFGSTCNPNTKECVVGTACLDEHQQKTPLGVTTDCAPYRCAQGACLARCASAADCFAPSLCNLDGKCVDPGDNAGHGEDGCNAGASGSGDAAWLLVTFGVIVSAGRRRSRRSQGR